MRITRREGSNLTDEVWVLSLNIPPCTHLEYPESKLELGFVSDGNPVKLSDEGSVWVPVLMHFTDTQGREWRRTRVSLKAGSEPKSLSEPIEIRMNIAAAGARVRKAESCTDAGKGG